MTPIIYTFGGGQYLNSVFESMSMLFDFSQNDSLIWLFRISALLGIIIVILQSFAQRSASGAASSIDWIYFVRFFFVWFIVIVPKSDVEIQDITTKATYKVSGAPWSVSILGWFTSSIGMGFVNMYETILGGGMNPVEQYSHNGIAFGSRYYTTLPSIARFTSKNMERVSPFISECLIPAVGPINSRWSGITKNDLFSSPDYEGAISRMNPNFLKNRYVYVGDVSVTCYDLREQLKSSIVSDSDAVLNLLSISIGVANAQVISDVDHDYIAQATTQSANSLRQAMMINAIQATAVTMAVSNNDPALADALTSAQVQQQQITAWRQGSQQASVSMIWLHIVVECLIYVLFPLLCFLFLLPGGWNTLTKYVKVMFWIQLWPVLYAALNSIIAVYATSKSQALAQVYTGITFDNFYAIADLNTGVVATAGYLTTMIPVISWMMVQGVEMGISSIAGQFQGSISNTAESAGKQESLGSLDINRVSVRNTDTAGQNKDGLLTNTHVGSTGSTTEVGGYETVQSRAMDNKIITSVDYAKTAQSQISNMIQSVHQRAGQEASQWNKVAETFHNAAVNNSGGNSSSSGTGMSNKDMYDKLSQLSSDVAIAASAMAKVGIPLSGITGLSASTGMEIKGTLASQAMQDYKKAVDNFKDFANKHNISTDNVVADGFKSANGLAQNSSKTISDALSVSRAQTTLNSMGDTVKVNGDNAFVQDLMAQGMTGEQINDMQVQNPGEFNRRAQKFAEEKFVPQILGDNTNYSVKEVDVAGTEKAINQHAGKYANNGNIDRYTEKAQAGINNAKQQIEADQQAVKQSYDKQADNYNNHKGRAMGENMVEVGSAAGDIITADGQLTAPAKKAGKAITDSYVKAGKEYSEHQQKEYNKNQTEYNKFKTDSEPSNAEVNLDNVVKEPVRVGMDKVADNIQQTYNEASDNIEEAKQISDARIKSAQERGAIEQDELQKIKSESIEKPTNIEENLTDK